MGNGNEGVPKVIVDNFDKEKIAFYDATGAHAGSCLEMYYTIRSSLEDLDTSKRESDCRNDTQGQYGRIIH